MMTLSEKKTTSARSDSSVNQRRKIIFGTCLVISLAIHLITICVVLLASTPRMSATAVTYIDLKEIASSAPFTPPVIQKPPQPPESNPADRKTSPPSDELTDTAKTEATAAPAAPAIPEILTTPLGRGMTSGYFSSLAEGRNLRDDIREYYFLVLEKINKLWWQKAETLREVAQQDGIVEFLIGRDGTLYDLRLSKSTGSREVDRAIIEVLRDVAPYPPLPDSYKLDMFRAPLRIATPSHLFNLRNLRK